MDRYPPATEYITRTQAAFDVTALTTAWDIIDPHVWVNLITTDFSFDADMTNDDVFALIAGYPGYDSQDIPLGNFIALQNEPNGDLRVGATLAAQFRGPTDLVPVTVYGHYLAIGTGTPSRVIRLFRYLQPVVLSSDLQYLWVHPLFTMPVGATRP